MGIHTSRRDTHVGYPGKERSDFAFIRLGCTMKNERKSASLFALDTHIGYPYEM